MQERLVEGEGAGEEAMLEMAMTKPEEVWTEEEQELYTTTIAAKKRKNARDRERKLEKKAMLEMVMSKLEEDRTEEEQTTMAAKKRKNEGDPLRTKGEDYRARKNARRRARKLEKTAMLEMVMSKSEEDRTEEFRS